MLQSFLKASITLARRALVSHAFCRRMPARHFIVAESFCVWLSGIVTELEVETKEGRRSDLVGSRVSTVTNAFVPAWMRGNIQRVLAP